MRDNYWFADVADDPDTDRWPWQPFLQQVGCCFPLPVNFETKEACEAFIATIPAGTQFDGPVLPDAGSGAGGSMNG